MTVSVSAPASEAPATAPEGMTTTGVPVSTPAAADAPPAGATSTPTEAPAGDRPAWLPAGFDTPEAFAKAYTELAAKGAPAADAPPAGTAPTLSEVEGKVSDAGLSMDEFVSEFEKSGALSAESYAKLAKGGLDKGFVDSFIAGQQALQQNFVSSVHETVGGSAEFAKVQNWARANLSPGEAAAFNSVMEKGDLETSKLAVRGLQARYVAANGEAPTLIGGGAGAAPGGFESTAQVTAAMSDPRYRTDSAYRDGVIAKLGRSNVFGR